VQLLRGIEADEEGGATVRGPDHRFGPGALIAEQEQVAQVAAGEAECQPFAGRRKAQGRGRVLNQFGNNDNPLAHYRTTGPEIWEQTGGEVTAFVSSVGTGGTLAGTALYLKERNPRIATVCADPYGAAMWSWFTNGNTDIKDGDSFAEGIGQMRVTKNIEGAPVDKAYRVEDQLALSIVYQLLREEGLFLGLSSGINLGGALRYAKEQGPGQTIVTILCDSGHKYQSKLFNPAWLAAQGLDPNKPVDSALPK